MKKIQILFFSLLLCLITGRTYAQEKSIISGKVISTLNLPVKDAIVSITGGEDAQTDENGAFTIQCKNPKDATFSVWASGYYTVLQAVDGRKELSITLIPESQYKYDETKALPFRSEQKNITTSADNINKKDFLPASSTIDKALAGQIAGLQITKGSGMPGEGSYINLRGIRSFIGNNAPLFIINGVPYNPDTNDSPLINGLSKNIFSAYNINDIKNITVLKGAEAALYGSMGANGVIIIETETATSDNLNTEISYYGQFGINWNNKRMPLLNGLNYKSYLSEIGATHYANMDAFYTDFPFMGDLNSKHEGYYNNNTDWQDEIYQKGFVTDNLFRVKGGDAIAKYDLSLGYAQEQGIIKGTDQNRYHTLLNANILVNKKFEIYTTVGLAYLDGDYQEQGMTVRTNPILAAYAKSPILSPYQKTMEGDLTPIYSQYYFGICENLDYAVSNPTAIVNTLDATNRQYDVNIKAGFKYKPLNDLTVNGFFGIYYKYNKEHLFIPGKSDKTIIPNVDNYGSEENTVRDGVGETTNFFYNLNAQYRKRINSKNVFNAILGAQVLTSKHEYDGAYARNTTNDYYQVMGASDKLGKYFDGYLEKWNWMNFYAHADYTFNNTLNASVNMSVDGSSATGKYADRFYVYPAVGLTWMIKNMPFLLNKEWINRLNLRAEYSMTGNSRFSSNYGRSYYSSSSYQAVSGIVRTQIPNQHLKPEITSQINLSLEAGLFKERISLGMNYYKGQTKDVIMNLPKSSAYGSSAYYANCAKIDNSGIELSAQASLVRLRDFEWIVGGNIAFIKNEIKSLGGNEQNTIEYSDGSRIISRVGGNPYEFYGLQAIGVFSTQADADKADLVNSSNQRYDAGDVHFVDQNHDGRIDYNDYVSLGSATPDYFGGFYTNIRYKNFALSTEFSYTKGNEVYNAVRRNLESADSFSNQSEAVANRWSLEGQITNIPRAKYGDPIGNNDFSSRWIEDGSFLRMRNITLSYSFDKPIWNFFRSGMVYVTGENLWTGTKYLGLDPEFAYSAGNSATQGFDYAKVMQPKSIKLGINLKF